MTGRLIVILHLLEAVILAPRVHGKCFGGCRIALCCLDLWNLAIDYQDTVGNSELGYPF